MAFYSAGLTDSPVTINGTIGGRSASHQRKLEERIAADANGELGDYVTTILIPSTEITGHSTAEPEEDQHQDPIMRPSDKPKRLDWLKHHLHHTHSKTELVSVKMRQSEYLRHFAKDETNGQYRVDVVEPPEGRAEWLRRRVEEQGSWKTDEES